MSSGDALIIEAMEVEAAIARRLVELGMIKRRIGSLLDRKGKLTINERMQLVSLLHMAKGEPQDER